MNKILITSILALSIMVSLVSGTLASYTKTLRPIEGQVVAKQFYIGTSKTMFPNIKLSPGEKNTWNFDVVNFKDNVETEVDMDMDIILSVEAQQNKQPIDGLVAGLYENGIRLGTDIIREGQVRFTIEKAFLANIKGTRSFEVRVEWKNGMVSDEIDTQNMDNQNTSKIGVTVTGRQCLHTDGEVPNPGGDQSDGIITSAQRLTDGRYEMTFENNKEDMTKGWLMEFSTDNDSILSNIGSLSVTKGSDTQWNTVTITKIKNGRWQIMPAAGYQNNAISFLKGEKLTLRLSGSTAPHELNISSAIIKVPYDINGISAGFRYDGYNMFIDLNNKLSNSKIYGWTIGFKTDARLNTSTSGVWKIEQIDFDGQFYTYVISTLQNTSDGRVFLNPNEKKEIMNTSTATHYVNLVVKDVKFFNQNINYTIN